MQATTEQMQTNEREMEQIYSTAQQCAFSDMTNTWARGTDGPGNIFNSLVSAVEDNGMTLIMHNGGALCFADDGRVWYFGAHLDGVRGGHYYAANFAEDLRRWFKMDR